MSKPKWTVKEAVPQKDYTIDLVFADGQHKVYDAAPLLEMEVFAPLKSLSLFLAAKIECGTVVWSDELDIAPEHLYEKSVPVSAS